MSVYDVGSGKNVITIQQALAYAQAAGFQGQALVTAVAIAMAESGLDTNSANTTTSGVGIDRGIVKFNSYFHSEVSDACAYDPACAFKEFYRVSQGGTNFCEWCTYNKNCATPCNSNGPYTQFVAQVSSVFQGSMTSPGINPATGTVQAGSPKTQSSTTQAGWTLALAWLNDPIRIIKLVVGMGLIFISLFLLTSPEGQFMQKVEGFKKYVTPKKRGN